MAGTPTRLSKQARRDQLLDTALMIVRTRGTDALTLLTLAESGGVSRPIAYDHFGTRSGLLLALYRQLDDRHRTAASRAIEAATPSAPELAQVISSAYFACLTDMPELTALSAALKGDPEMEAAQREMYDAYTELIAGALRPYSTRTPEALRLLCTGILGAAEAIASALNHQHTTLAEATAALADLIVGSLDTR
jgi:AcrR family transcriptional regulator